MNLDKHPSELNLFQQYLRTVKVAKSTSRMKNPAWYQAALELDVQVHCYLKDAGGATCYLHVKSKRIFEKIDRLSSRQLEQRDELEKFIDSILKHEAAVGAKALGVIFYLADEFSIAGLGPEHQNPVELNHLRDMMLEDPMAVLDDKTISTETHSWRLFPYAGASAGSEFATAVAVSRRQSKTLKTLREIGNQKNFPVRTSAVSAPLCAIALMPWLSKAAASGTIALFNYENFTLMAFFNSHCDLMMLRFMSHASGDAYPANIGPAILSTATAFELENPDIKLFSMVGHDLQGLVITLKSAIAGTDVSTINPAELLNEFSLPVDLPLEYIATTEDLDLEIHPLGNNETFTSLREESWHLQDFLSPDQDEIDSYPGQADMKLLKIGKRLKKVAAMLLIGILVYSGLSISIKIKSDAWSYEPKNLESSNIGLTAELKKYERWNNLLMDRSKAWVSMELVARLMPNDGTAILKDVLHRVNPKPGDSNEKSGFTKEWTINGYGSDKGIEFVERFSTREGIKKLFREVARDSGNSIYMPNVSERDVNVSLKQQPNPSYNTISPQKPGDNFPKQFTMVISQNITSDDEMALAALKDPSN